MVATAATVAGASLEMADKFENAHARLEQAFRNVHRPAEQFSAQINQAQKTLERYGFTNADVQESLGNLVTATRSPEKAFRDIGLAADLARYKHIGLAEAATTLAKAEAGQLRPLKQLGIDLPIAAGGAVKLQQAKDALAKAEENYNQVLDRQHGKHKLSIADHIALQNAQEKVKAAQEKVNSTAQTGTRIQQELAKIVGGQAAAASETLAGKQARLRAQFTDMGVKLGTALMPVLMKTADVIENDVVPAMEHFGTWASHNQRAIKDVAEAIAVIAGVKFVGGKIASVNRLAKTATSVLTGKGLAGKAADELAGRGSPTNPLYVVMLDKAPFHPKASIGQKVKDVVTGRGSKSIITRAAEKIGLRGAARTAFLLGGPVVDVATLAAGDQAPLPPMAKRHNPYAQLFAINDPAGRKDFPASDYHHGQLSIQSAVNTLAGSGDPMKIRELQRAAAIYPQIAAAVKTLESQVGSLSGVLKSASQAAAQTAANGGVSIGDALNRGVDRKIRSGLARAASGDARIAVAQIAKNAATAAGDGGESIGAALADGVARGIESHKAHALAAAGKLTSQAVGEMQRAGLISSPSKKTSYLGQMLAAGLERGMHMGAKGVSDTARELMGTILGNFQASASLGNLSTSGTDRLGGPMSTPLTAAGIVAFLGGQRTQDRNVVRNLAMARKHGVGAGLLQEIAQMEPTQGAAYAAALARATPAQVRAINSDEKAIAQYGRQAGGLVTLSQRTIDQLSRGIAHSVRSTPIHVSVSKLDRHNGVAVVISP